MEVAINKQFSGFSLSIEAQLLFFVRKGYKELFVYKRLHDANCNYVGVSENYKRNAKKQ